MSKCKHEQIGYEYQTKSFKKVDRFVLIRDNITMKAFCEQCEKDLPKKDIFITFGVYGDFNLKIDLERDKIDKKQKIKYAPVTG